MLTAVKTGIVVWKFMNMSKQKHEKMEIMSEKVRDLENIFRIFIYLLHFFIIMFY